MGLKKLIDLDLLDRFLGKVKELIPTKTSELENDAGFMDGMTILSYGSSTWADFIAAYGDNKVVYCRASSGSNPASGSQTRLAFMAYVNNAATPTEVEFQYYRSVNAHTDAQQGDQVYVYKLNKTNGWSVTVRNAFSKLATGTGLTHTYSNGTITIANSETVPGVVSTTSDGLAPQLPDESTTTKFLRQDATWAVPPDTTYESKVAASGGTDVSLVTTGEKYEWNNKGTYSKPSGGIPASDLASGVIPTVPTAYTSNPAMDGTASPGSSGSWAKGDHVHPTDTSRQVKITASGILKGNGSGGVSAAVAGTDYLTPATNYSPVRYIIATPYNISADDIGATVCCGYGMRNTPITVSLTQAVSTTLPIGTEIAILNYFDSDITIAVSGIQVGVSGIDGGGPTKLFFSSTSHNFKPGDIYSMLALKKISSDSTYGDCWLLTGNVEVVS